ncbi:family 78 glycoside hydrolase catalytic domain [Rahnella inusitata]|uniref:alpha-L-rhamnosidase n=1 Tax=Rahnella inusitata TaxID=58169 RepID=UPI0039B0077A
MLSIAKLTLDLEPVLQGVDRMPVIGWEIESHNRNVKQVSYWLQISPDENFSTVIFDSGKVNSETSNNLDVGEISLQPSTRYFVRVQVQDNHGQTSDWCSAAYFITGLLNSGWQAEFISAETPADKNSSATTSLRKSFAINNAGDIAFAVLHVSALGLYEFHLNGQKVGNDELTPGWTSYHHHLLYQTYDLTGLLQSGENVMGAILGAGWFKGDMGFTRDRNYYGEQTALICQLVIHYKDGRKDIIYSDSGWKGNNSPILFSEIYDGEIYDARKELSGWDNKDYPATSWRPVNIVRYDKTTLTAQGSCKVRQIELLNPQEMIITPEGDRVIDFGQNLSGWVEFKATGRAGDQVILRHFEVLDANGNVYLDNLRSAKQRVEYTLKGDGEEIYHPHFTWQGFRYVKVEEYPGEVNLDNFTAIVLHSAMEPTGHFACSNPDLNQLHHNILWGLKGNFVDVPTDCPQRDERLGWTGDAQIFCRTASYLMQTRNFFAKWLTDLRFDQTPEGGVPHVIPDILDGRCGEDRLLSGGGTHSASAWADAAVINPWTMYLMYGDTRVLENQYGSMKGWIDFMQAHAENNIWRYRLQFGDWVALDAKEGSYFGATPNDLTCTAYYAWSTLLFAKAAKALNRQADHESYLALHHAIVRSFQEEFFTPTGRLAARTQTAHILALYFNLVPDAFRQRTTDTLVELLEEQGGHLVTGFVGTPYFCHALSQNGRAKEAWALLLKDDFPSWLYQVKAGATTIWEHWDGIKPDGSMWSADMNSFNHYAYGAVGEWLYRVVAGIEADEQQPGFKHALISPLTGGGLDWVRAGYHSVYGEISVQWKVIGEDAQGKTLRLDVGIPANSTATISLLAADSVPETDGVDFVRNATGLTAEVGSGRYQITYVIKE